MAKARKNTMGYWVVTFRDEKGYGRTRSFGRDKDAKGRAEQFAAEVDYRKTRGEPIPLSRVEGIYLDQLCQLWVDEKKAQGRKYRWLKEWIATFNKIFLPQLCSKPAHRITQADVIAIVGEHYTNCSQATRNRYIRYLKGIFEYGVVQGHLRANPLARWKNGKEERRKSLLTLDHFQAIHKVAPPHLSWALEVAWAIPCRPGPSDLFSLRFDRNFQPDRNGSVVYHTKVGKWAFIELAPPFISALTLREKQHKSGHFIEYRGHSVQRLDTSLENAAKKAGLSYCPCLYDVRHLWITTALDKGLEPSVIAYMAGTSVEMIHRNYYEPHAVEKARAAVIMPRLFQSEVEIGRKVVSIQEAMS